MHGHTIIKIIFVCTILNKTSKSEQLCFVTGMISSFRFEVDENCSRLDNYVASCGSSLPTSLEDETNQQVVPKAVKKPPLLTANSPQQRSSQLYFTNCLWFLSKTWSNTMHLLTQSNYIANVSVAVTTTIIKEDNTRPNNTAVRMSLPCHAHITILRVSL